MEEDSSDSEDEKNIVQGTTGIDDAIGYFVISHYIINFSILLLLLITHL